MESLAPRTSLSVSPRGLGRSSRPAGGYSLDHRVADLEAVLDELGPEHFCLMAYSLGVPVGIAYAARNSPRVRGLLLVDYPARYPQRPVGWLEKALPFAKERGIPEDIVRGIQAESQHVELWEELAALQRPVLLVKAGKSSVVSPDDLQRYDELPQVQIEVFEGSDHEIEKPDYGRFLGTIETFLEQLTAPDAVNGPQMSKGKE